MLSVLLRSAVVMTALATASACAAPRDEGEQEETQNWPRTKRDGGILDAAPPAIDPPADGGFTLIRASVTPATTSGTNDRHRMQGRFRSNHPGFASSPRYQLRGQLIPLSPE